MAPRRLLSEREELRETQLMQGQPKSTRGLQQLLDKIKARIVQAALKSPKVAERLEHARYRVLGVDLTQQKPSEDEPTASRLAEVGIYDYDRNALVVPVVNLRSGQVVAVEERKGIQPPLTPEEFEEAQRIALAGAQLRNLANRRDLEVVAHPTQRTPAGLNESHPAFNHRCFTIYFWSSGEQPAMVAEAIVDLSTRQVVPAAGGARG